MRRDLHTQTIGLPLPGNLSAVLRAGFASLLADDYRLLRRLDAGHPMRRDVLVRIARLRADIDGLAGDA